MKKILPFLIPAAITALVLYVALNTDKGIDFFIRPVATKP